MASLIQGFARPARSQRRDDYKDLWRKSSSFIEKGALEG
jgi:hypothetical protein